MELAAKAVERLVDNLEHQNDFEYFSGDDHGYSSGDSEEGWEFVRLRVDQEFANDEYALSEQEVMQVTKLMLTGDVCALVEDGDCQDTQDHFLKNLDGSKKRGVEPVAVDIPRAKLFIEKSSKRNSTNYTLYFLLAVKWPV